MSEGNFFLVLFSIDKEKVVFVSHNERLGCGFFSI
jgi:hypothetical protein